MPVNNEKRGDGQDQGDTGMLPGGTPPSDDPYANIYGWVQDLLEETDATLPGSKLTRYVTSTLNFLRSTFPCLPVYADLSDSDTTAMDEVVGHLIAARYRRKHPKQATGDVLELKQGPIDYKYAPGVQNRRSLEDEWVNWAYSVLGQLSCIATLWTSLQAVNLFQPAGRRREQAARGVNTRSLNPLFTLLADEFDAETQDPIHLPYIAFGIDDPFSF